MNRKDLLAAATLLLIAAAYYWSTLQIPSSTLDDGVGPRGFPVVLTVALVAVAAAIAVRALTTAPVGARTAGDADGPEARWPRALGLLTLGALYVQADQLRRRTLWAGDRGESGGGETGCRTGRH
jgi:hypothetical protein